MSQAEAIMGTTIGKMERAARVVMALRDAGLPFNDHSVSPGEQHGIHGVTVHVRTDEFTCNVFGHEDRIIGALKPGMSVAEFMAAMAADPDVTVQSILPTASAQSSENPEPEA
jgi:hypothetical protein